MTTTVIAKPAAFSLPTNLASVEGFIGAMYGYAIGSNTMTQVNADIVSYGGLNNTLNAYYSAGFGSQTTAAVAASVVANLGVVAGQNGLVAADVTQAVAYVTGVLNAAPANARGAAILTVVNLYNGLAGTTGPLANFSSAASAWTTNQASAVQYAGSNASDALLSKVATVVATAAAVPSTATLTSGIDYITGNAAGNNSINGSDAVVGITTQPTFTAGDTIALTGTNNVLNWITSAQITGTPAGSTISGVQTANVNSTGNAALTLDVTKGWTGLTQLNVTNAANATTAAAGDSVTVTAPATTNLNVTSGNTLTAGTITTLGGLGVTATLVNAGFNTGIATSIGTLVQPAGAGPVVVNDSEAIIGVASTTYKAGGTNIYGGTTVSVTQTIAPDSASASTLAGSASAALTIDAGGAVNVYGTKSTTSVSVTQTPQSGAVAGSAAATGFTGAAAIVDGTVLVQDINATGSTAGTIASVSLTNFGGTIGSPSVINSSTLSSLTLSATSTGSPVGVPTAGTNVGQIGGSYGTATAAFANNTPGYSLSTAQSVTSNGYLSVVNPLAATTVTALTLNLAGGSGNLITFSGAGMANVTTLNVVTSAATSTAPITGGQFKTINISGSGVAALGSTANSGTTLSAGGNGGFNAAADNGLTALNVSGAAGFSDGNGAGSRSGLNTFGSALTITNTGTGKFTAYIDPTTQTYVAGAAGTSIITVNADVVKPITAGAGTSDEIIFAAAPTLTTAGSGTNITGFEIFGVGVGASGGTFDMSKFVSDSFSTIDVAASTSTGTYTFKNVTGNVLNVGTSATNTAAAGNNITYTVADANGPLDNLTVNIGSTSATSGTVFNNTNTLALNDASGQGIGNLVINANVSTAAGTSTAINDTLALTDGGLTSLTINGGAGLTITGNQTISSSVLTIVDNSTALNANGSAWTDGFTGSITDAILSTISYTGSHSFSIGGISTSSPVLNVTNSNSGTTGVVALGTVTDTNLISISLKGSVSGTFASTIAPGSQFTLSGATDNSNVSVTLTNGAGATFADNITLGNGTNTIVDPSIAGIVNITVGTGVNNITAGGTTTNTTGSYNITAAYHTAADTFRVGTGGSYVASAPNYNINGVQTGDIIVLNGNGVHATTPANISGAPSVSAAISALETATNSTQYVATSAYVASAGVTLIASNNTGANNLTSDKETLIQVNGNQKILAANLVGTNESLYLASTSGGAIPASYIGTGQTTSLSTHTLADTIGITSGNTATIAGLATGDTITASGTVVGGTGLSLSGTANVNVTLEATAHAADTINLNATTVPTISNFIGGGVDLLSVTPTGQIFAGAVLVNVTAAAGNFGALANSAVAAAPANIFIASNAALAVPLTSTSTDVSGEFALVAAAGKFLIPNTAGATTALLVATSTTQDLIFKLTDTAGVISGTTLVGIVNHGVALTTFADFA